MSTDAIRADFDRIAALHDWANPNDLYQSFLLKHVSSSCDTILEVGCGTGSLTRGLADRASRVIAIDLSPGMIEQARRHCNDKSNIEFHVTDIREWTAAAASYDGIISVATLHHIPLEPFLVAARDWLRPGGRLLVLDLLRNDGWIDHLRNFVALPTSVGLRLIRTGRLRSSQELRAAWRDHGSRDQYLSFAEARAVYERLLSGAKVRRHLLWRYSVVWEKAEQ